MSKELMWKSDNENWFEGLNIFLKFFSYDSILCSFHIRLKKD